MDNAAWPSQTVPDPIKDLVAHFYSIVDSEGTNTGVKLAEDIFTDDGELIINKRNWVGSDSTSHHLHAPLRPLLTPLKRHFGMASRRRVCNLALP